MAESTDIEYELTERVGCCCRWFKLLRWWPNAGLQSIEDRKNHSGSTASLS